MKLPVSIKKVGLLTAVLGICFSFAANAWADDAVNLADDQGGAVLLAADDDADEDGQDAAKKTTTVKDDSIEVKKLQVQSGKINIEAIKMTASESEKLVVVHRDAVEWAASQGKNIGVLTNDASFSIPASAIVESDEWAQVSGKSSSFQLRIELDDDYGLSLSQDFSASAQRALNCTAVSNRGLGIEIYLLGGNKAYTYINKLDQPMTVTYDYQVGYRASTRKPAEKSLALVWADVDKKFDSTKVTNELLTSKVDLNKKTVTVQTTYCRGAFALAGQTGADNTKTTFGGDQSQTAAPGLTGAVNTAGVPAWAASDVAAMQQAKVVPSDLTGKNFGAPISRAEFAAYIVRTLNVTAAAAKNPFADVAAGNEYYDEILTAVNAGLVAGRSATEFAPDANITRQEMAVLFQRALNHQKMTYSVDSTKLDAMPDAADVADWAGNGAAACVNTGLIAGKDGGKFAPLATTSWAEAVVMLNRLHKMIR